MMDFEYLLVWIKTIWPIFVLLIGLVIRNEVSQQATKSQLKNNEINNDRRMKHLETEIARVEKHNETNVLRIERKIDGGFTEIRADIKLLLGKLGKT